MSFHVVISYDLFIEFTENVLYCDMYRFYGYEMIYIGIRDVDDDGHITPPNLMGSGTLCKAIIGKKVGVCTL